MADEMNVDQASTRGDLRMHEDEVASQVRDSVLKLYLAHPYPMWSREERQGRLRAELWRYHFLGLSQALPGAYFLDVGCGTGNRSMLVTQYCGVDQFIGAEQSKVSLAVAQNVAAEEGMDRFAPVNCDLFSLPFPDRSFDVVVSWGVLHHTHDPYRGLQEMVRVCRVGGGVGVYLYNKWNHWRHNLQKARVARLAGDDVEDRFAVAHKLYGRTPIESMSPEEIAVFYDQYCHPHKSDHTVGETLRWFDQLGLAYNGSYPPLRFRDHIKYLSMRRETKVSAYKPRGVLGAVAALSKRPEAQGSAANYERPSWLHRALWAAAFAWAGRQGQYSGGVALAGRKV